MIRANEIENQKFKKLEKSLIFIAMVSEKIECNLQDVVLLSDQRKQKIVKELLEGQIKYGSPDDVYAEENEAGELDICMEFRIYNYF